MVLEKKLKPSKSLEEFLTLKKIRTLSGVAPVAVLTKPWPCPGDCVYCPTQVDMPKSYLDDEPAVLRAINFGFDAKKQVRSRLAQYEATGHTAQKIELIVMGGTFSNLPDDYKINFIKDCFDACNKTISNNLLQAQKTNENTKYRIIGLTLETRPDCIDKKEIALYRKLGCTRVELGVQSVYNDVLKLVNRGHNLLTTVKATKLLKDSGFKICYHLMPNLPGSDLKRDFKMFEIIFEAERFKPDMIKIYPCVVCYQAKLHQWFLDGKYQPYSDDQLINLLIKIKKIVPQWVRINRLGRDIPIKNISAGFKISNIRQVLAQKGAKCQCIRCREIRNLQLSGKLRLNIIDYQASEGKEYFLQYVDDDNKLFSLLRLRLAKSAIIREVHTYGQALAILKKQKLIQHQGLGKKLIAKAESIAKKSGFKKISVIAGVGVRDYYRKLGYELESSYMVKYLK
jgi:elongator complex protein 3